MLSIILKLVNGNGSDMQPSDFNIDPNFAVLGFWLSIVTVCAGSLIAFGFNATGLGVGLGIFGLAGAIVFAGWVK